MQREIYSKLETEPLEKEEKPEGYEKPRIRRHAVVMTMAPAGSKMRHGLFPFETRRSKTQEEHDRELSEERSYSERYSSPYRRT